MAVDVPDAQQPRQSATTFFDGSYFSYDEGESPPLRRTNQQFFEYFIPSWRYFYNGALFVLDVAMTLIATYAVLLISPNGYVQLRTRAALGIAGFLMLAGASWLISLVFSHSYERHTMGEGYALYGKIMNACFVDFTVLCVAAYLLRLEFPRTLIVTVPVLSTVLTIMERWMMRHGLHHLRERGHCSYATVILGSPNSIRLMIAQLHRNKNLGYRPVAVCPVRLTSEASQGAAAADPVSAPFTPACDEERKLTILPLGSRLPQTIKHLKARTLLIADVVTVESETLRALALAVESMGIELAITANIAGLNAAVLHFRDNPAMPVLNAQLPQYSAPIRLTKRLMDISFSTLALIVFSPVMLWVSIMVKSEDGGPIIYSQTRVGLYSKPFTMYKFRSMYTNADEIKAKLAKRYGMENRFIFKLKNDPRVTNIGRFIRKTSLDEFPQFFNVLKGDMSLVGPRPPLPEEVSRYQALYSTRLLVKPGITGPWQISGRSDLTKEQSEYVDVSYIQNWSLAGDLGIILKTVSAVLHSRGSY